MKLHKKGSKHLIHDPSIQRNPSGTSRKMLLAESSMVSKVMLTPMDLNAKSKKYNNFSAYSPRHN